MHFTKTLAGVTAMTLCLSVRQTLATCETYGIDYVNGGSYFINKASTAPFQAVQEFSGCQNDTSNNILVDPNGNQWQCSNTPMVPDYTRQTLTCPSEHKDDMYTGDWSILIISNNGDADPIDYQRDFYLSVGVQSTTTYTPTVTVTAVKTSVTTSYTTKTDTVTTTLKPQTTTTHELVEIDNGTRTEFLPAQIITQTATTDTITQTQYNPSVTTAMATAGATCSGPSPNYIADPKASIQPHLGLPSPASAKFHRALAANELSGSEKAAFIASRRARLASEAKLHKRTPNAATKTVTQTNTSLFKTVTTTVDSGTSTAHFTSTVHVTSTVTPAPVTVYETLCTLSVPFVQVSVPPVTATWWEVGRAWETSHHPWTVAITGTTTDPAAATLCAANGGHMV